MNKKKHLKKVIADLTLIQDGDELISDIVRELQAHAETLEDDSSEGEEDPGSNNPGKKPPLP